MTFHSIDPANGETIWTGKADTAPTIDAAISRARGAFQAWAELPLEERLVYMDKWKSTLEKHSEELALTISRDTGKTLWETRGEAKAMIGKVSLSIEAYRNRTGLTEREVPGGRAVVRHKPHGVVAVFGPFNFPGHLPNGHIVPALIAGNTVIFKPSELTPLVGETMVNLWRETGLPDGVLNLVQGGAETGKLLSAHPGIDGLFFTGSSRTGRILSEAFGKTPEKILALELGGNNPLVVDEVADQQGAAYAAIQSAFITSGQRCTCARRLIVGRGAEGDAFLEELLKMSRAIRIGAYTDKPEPFYGPQVSKEAADAVAASYDHLIALGAQPLLALQRRGHALVTPSILDVTDIDAPDEETFGPMLQVIRVADLNEAIAVANKTAYGLAAGILTDSREKWERFLLKSRAGIVNWNNQTTGASGAAPFGGIGLSGNHRPSAYYAADYCAYPVASMEKERALLPETLSPGIELAKV